MNPGNRRRAFVAVALVAGANVVPQARVFAADAPADEVIDNPTEGWGEPTPEEIESYNELLLAEAYEKAREGKAVDLVPVEAEDTTVTDATAQTTGSAVLSAIAAQAVEPAAAPPPAEVAATSPPPVAETAAAPEQVVARAVTMNVVQEAEVDNEVRRAPETVSNERLIAPFRELLGMAYGNSNSHYGDGSLTGTPIVGYGGQGMYGHPGSALVEKIGSGEPAPEGTIIGVDCSGAINYSVVKVTGIDLNWCSADYIQGKQGNFIMQEIANLNDRKPDIAELRLGDVLVRGDYCGAGANGTIGKDEHIVMVSGIHPETGKVTIIQSRANHQNSGGVVEQDYDFEDLISGPRMFDHLSRNVGESSSLIDPNNVPRTTSDPIPEQPPATAPVEQPAAEAAQPPASPEPAAATPPAATAPAAEQAPAAAPAAEAPAVEPSAPVEPATVEKPSYPTEAPKVTGNTFLDDLLYQAGKVTNTVIEVAGDAKDTISTAVSGTTQAATAPKSRTQTAISAITKPTRAPKTVLLSATSNSPQSETEGVATDEAAPVVVVRGVPLRLARGVIMVANEDGTFTLASGSSTSAEVSQASGSPADTADAPKVETQVQTASAQPAATELAAPAKATTAATAEAAKPVARPEQTASSDTVEEPTSPTLRALAAIKSARRTTPASAPAEKASRPESNAAPKNELERAKKVLPPEQYNKLSKESRNLLAGLPVYTPRTIGEVIEKGVHTDSQGRILKEAPQLTAHQLTAYMLVANEIINDRKPTDTSQRDFIQTMVGITQKESGGWPETVRIADHPDHPSSLAVGVGQILNLNPNIDPNVSEGAQDPDDNLDPLLAVRNMLDMSRQAVKDHPEPSSYDVNGDQKPYYPWNGQWGSREKYDEQNRRIASMVERNAGVYEEVLNSVAPGAV